MGARVYIIFAFFFFSIVQSKSQDINDYFDFYGDEEDTSKLIGESKVAMICFNSSKPKEYISIKPLLYYQRDVYWIQGLDVEFVGIAEEQSLMFETDSALVLFEESPMKSAQPHHKVFIQKDSLASALWLFYSNIVEIQAQSTSLKPKISKDKQFFSRLLPLMSRIGFDWLTEPVKAAPEAQDVFTMGEPDENGYQQLFPKYFCSLVSGSDTIYILPTLGFYPQGWAEKTGNMKRRNWEVDSAGVWLNGFWIEGKDLSRKPELVLKGRTLQFNESHFSKVDSEKRFYRLDTDNVSEIVDTIVSFNMNGKIYKPAYTDQYYLLYHIGKFKKVSISWADK